MIQKVGLLRMSKSRRNHFSLLPLGLTGGARGCKNSTPPTVVTPAIAAQIRHIPAKPL